MIYDAEKKPIYARVFDANGLEWRWVFWCDTETGVIRHWLTDANDKILTNASRTELLSEEVKAAAPLLLVPF